MSKSTFSNAAGLLALLIARGIVTYTNLVPSDAEREELKGMNEAKRTKKLKTKIMAAVKKVEGKEAPAGISELRETLTQINERYPTIPQNIDDDIIKNITSVVATYSPIASRFGERGDEPNVAIPATLARGMQDEILYRRREEQRLKSESEKRERGYKKIQTARKNIKGQLSQERQESARLKERGDRYKVSAQQLEEQKRKLENDIERQRGVIATLERDIKNMSEEQKQTFSESLKKQLTATRAKLTKANKGLGQKLDELGQLTRTEGQETRQVINIEGQETRQVINTRFEELKVASTIRGNQRQKIIPEKKEGKERESKGLGLSSRQRTQLKQIITTETNAEYANVVDMIAGDNIADMTPYDLTMALIGLGLSVAIPIPNRLYTNVLQQLGRETGFAEWFNNLFETQNIDGDNIVLEQKNNVRDIEQVINTIPASISGVQKESKLRVEDDKHTAGPGSTDLSAKADLKQQRDNRGRFTKKMQAGAAIAGLTTYAATGSTPAALVGAGAGALAVAAYPAINQIAGPTISRIGDALAERMPDTIPTATGVKRAIQRQITTDTKDIPNPIPTLSRRGANQQEMATAYNRIDVLDNEYNELKERQRTLEAQMMANIDMGISNTELGLTGLVRRIAEQLRQNRDEVRQINDEIDQGPRARVDFNREGLGIPIPRRTTDEEKALVPFNEAEERTTYDKKKALAIAGAVGGAVVAGGIAGSGTFKERPIEVPTIVYNQQQGKEFDTTMPNMARGMLRPKFIMPDADILQPSNQELAADALEFAMFDFVEPSSEGAEGTNQTNILKAFQKENENIRYRGAGVVVNSLFGNDVNDLTTQQINKMFLGPELPPMIFSEIQQNLSEYEVNQFDVNNEITGIEFFSPYNNFTDVNPGLNENMSMLFDVVP
jgi:hypothetical protein